METKLQLSALYLNRCGALGPTALKGEDVPITEQQDTHVLKAYLLGQGVLPGQRHCQRPGRWQQMSHVPTL